jgi:hypothetical protein
VVIAWLLIWLTDSIVHTEAPISACDGARHRRQVAAYVLCCIPSIDYSLLFAINCKDRLIEDDL